MVEFKDIARALWKARNSGEKVALASIINIRGSSPRHNGARMLVWPDGRIVGTIGGGTLEYRVIQDAIEALSTQESQYLNYIFDASGRPGSVGLCGGSVDVQITVDLNEFAEISNAAKEALERGEMVTIASRVLEGNTLSPEQNAKMLIWPDQRTYGSLGNERLEKQIVEKALEAMGTRSSGLVFVDPEENNTESTPVGVHLDVLEPDETLLIVGAGHVAQPLAAMGSALGFRVCVVDDRPEWANAERFPTANEIAIIDYEPVHEVLAPIPYPMSPDTYVIITTWGYDLPAMEQALQQNPAYIGLVASPTKARVLFKRLKNAGFPEEEIQRIMAPIGLDIGAESPAEISISILAEILTLTRGKSGRPLREVRGAIINSLFRTDMNLAKEPSTNHSGVKQPA
ncbi:MAG TPA: XdhC/CoxI family protein [Anaerolineales bacterium]|nr:XdhC/CoxI family protein [Anaerolineales bacterium]